MISLKYLNKIFADYAENNTMINSYDSGYIFDINPDPEINYPLLFVELPSAVIDQSINYDFTIYAIDRLKEDDSNLIDVHNSTLKIVSDFRTYLRKNQELSSLLFVEDESPVDFFAHKYSDYTAGAKMEIKVKVLNNELLCDIPLNNFDFGEYINWTINYSSATVNQYSFSAGTGLQVTNNANNITYTYTGATSSGSSQTLIAGDNINLTSTGSSTTINSVLKFFTGGTGSGSIITTTPAATSFATGNNAVSIGVNNSANTAYSLCIGGQSNLINNTYSIRSVIVGGVSNRIYTTGVAAKHNTIINSYSAKIKGNSFLNGIFSGQRNKINNGQYSTIANGVDNYINYAGGGYLQKSTILNGSNNIISGSSSTILSGNGNKAISFGLIGGGNNNFCLSTNSVILNGSGNSIEETNNYSLILNGQNNTIYSSYGSFSNSIINGINNTVKGFQNTLINGQGNIIDSSYSMINGNNNVVLSSHTHCTIIGDEITSVKSHTLHLDNLKIYKIIYLNPFEITENYTLTVDDEFNFIMVNVTEPTTINLDNSVLDGHTLKIKDVAGNAGLHNITIAAENIDNSTTFVMRNNYACLELTYSAAKAMYLVTNYYS